MNEALRQKLEVVRARFRDTLPDRLSGIVEQLSSQDPDTDGIHRNLHEISGNAGMLGEKEIASALAPGFCIAEECAIAGREANVSEVSQIREAVKRAQRLLGRSQKRELLR